MSDGWFYTGECDTEEKRDVDGGRLYKRWAAMSYEELNHFKHAFITHDEYGSFVRQIDREIARRPPSAVEILSEVTITSKL